MWSPIPDHVCVWGGVRARACMRACCQVAEAVASFLIRYQLAAPGDNVKPRSPFMPMSMGSMAHP